jgi:membrane fusion protein (multidrug efflux system)
LNQVGFVLKWFAFPCIVPEPVMNRFKLFSPLLTAIPILLLSACGGPDDPPAPPPPAVGVQEVSLEPVTAEHEFVARTRAQEDSEIRARVTGTIIERNFDEGQVVEKDALLFRIDPRPYEAALSAAQANLARAVTALDVAQRNLNRGEELAPQGHISESEMDKLRGDRDSGIAAQSAAEAAVEKAEINLDFTQIRAPFTGTAGRSKLSIGDLVDTSSGPLVTLVQRDPMLADFDINERTLAQSIKNAQDRATQGLERLRYVVRMKLVTGDIYRHEGEIDYASNRVNPSTGTVTVTARFPNPDGTLIPGQFVRVVMQRGEAEMQMLIPQSSVLEDMQGRYVFIVDHGNSVVRKNITLGQRTGINWVVEEGLSEGDRVIVEGIQKVRPGMPVDPSPASVQPHTD